MERSTHLTHRSTDDVDNQADPSSSKPLPSDDPVLKRLGSRIRLIRQELHLSLEECAVLCQVNLTHISKVERGFVNPTVLHLNKLAHGLGVELVDLFKP
jgi:ribosome-binding protein aMBF1 (putative translation factor)